MARQTFELGCIKSQSIRLVHGEQSAAESGLFDRSASRTDAIETRLAIEAALDSLPPKLKHAFLLVKVEQFTSLEAADILKLPEGTVKIPRLRSDQTTQSLS